jgi:hypothetical protein
MVMNRGFPKILEDTLGLRYYNPSEDRIRKLSGVGIENKYWLGSYR